ncbi:MAG: hypothetical protein JSV63_00930 [Candidatus Aenigmatarchaeota archaeon]|nr:MAG: hypothetical protein JSV63_00930 [Candidatus Aenigmarchaeota archaeon]
MNNSDESKKRPESLDQPVSPNYGIDVTPEYRLFVERFIQYLEAIKEDDPLISRIYDFGRCKEPSIRLAYSYGYQGEEVLRFATNILAKKDAEGNIFSAQEDVPGSDDLFLHGGIRIEKFRLPAGVYEKLQAEGVTPPQIQTNYTLAKLKYLNEELAKIGWHSDFFSEPEPYRDIGIFTGNDHTMEILDLRNGSPHPDDFFSKEIREFINPDDSS